MRDKLSAIGKLCNVSESEAEDLIHDGYLRLVDKDVSTVNEARGKLWTTIRNLSVDSFRRGKKTVILSAAEYDEKQYSDYYHLDYDLLLKQIDGILSPLQVRIMKMLIIEDLDYPEIAVKLNMNEGAVRTNVSRARKILKEKLRL